MLRQTRPHNPVYCVYPAAYREAIRRFLKGFPGRVLYAVKANDDPAILRLMHECGVAHFDCASVAEIAAVQAHCPGARAYFMTPVRLRGAAREAFEEFGVRHFLIDDPGGLAPLAAEADLRQCVIFARMAVRHESAMIELSSKFGAPREAVPSLLRDVADRGAEPALAFNVGSNVTSPEAYRHALAVAGELLAALPFPIRLLDIGGGFSLSYPGFPVPPLEAFFDAILESRAGLPLAAGAELMAEPGRALAAPGLSAVTEVLLRKDGRLYINDGMYGIFWELRFKGHKRYPCRVLRDGVALAGPQRPFLLFGPTCDASDVLPEPFDLPDAIAPGDFIEFGGIGAYSLSGRTRFNGYYSADLVEITGAAERPPRAP